MSTPERPFTGNTSGVPTPAEAAIMAEVVCGFAAAHTEFTERVVEGYPAAWNELTRHLDNSWPVSLHGEKESAAHTVTATWVFREQEPPTAHLPLKLHISSRIMLLPHQEGDTEVVRAINELTKPPVRSRFRPPLEPLLGLQAFWDPERRTYRYHEAALLTRITEELVARMPYVNVGSTRAGGGPLIHKESYLSRERVSVANWLAKMGLIGTDPDGAAIEKVYEHCREEAERGWTRAASIVEHKRQLDLDAHFREREALDKVLEMLRDESFAPVLTGRDFDINW